MGYIYGFEKLQVWVDSRNLVKSIYDITRGFPDEEKFGLTSQMRRSAISIVSNIAEGSGRTTMKDQAHFYQISYSSLIELLNQLIISNDLTYIDVDNLAQLRIKLEKISIKLNALWKSRTTT